MSSIAGKIVDQRNTMPLEGVALSAQGEGADKQASSGAKGEFSIDGLAAGQYELVAKKQGYEDGIYGPLVVIDGVDTEISLALQPKLD